MKVVTITEAKNGLSALIDYVEGGESVLIVDRDRPVARLETAVSGAIDEADGRLARLRRAGIVRTSTTNPDARPVTKPPRPRRGASGVDALIQERRSGR